MGALPSQFCAKDTSPPGVKTSVRWGFLGVTECTHPAVTMLSQDEDYALNHVILLRRRSFKFPLPLSLKQKHTSACHCRCLLDTSTLNIFLKELLFGQFKRRHWFWGHASCGFCQIIRLNNETCLGLLGVALKESWRVLDASCDPLDFLACRLYWDSHP